VPPTFERIAISTWSLRNYFSAKRDNASKLPGPLLTLLDFPETILARYKVRHFEFCASHFPSTEPTYLHELKTAMVHTLTTVVCLSVNIEECGPEGTFSATYDEQRGAALDTVKLWVDVAQTLGVKSVCVAPGKVDPDNLKPTIESYKALSTYAVAKGVRVLVENHGGFGAENPEQLVQLVNLVGQERIGVLPDFANFPDEATRERGLRALLQYASTLCHVTGFEFDAEGTERSYDFAQAIQIATSTRFRGAYAIEYEGSGDPYAGIQKTMDELIKYL
jgi:sugar phosphate isomerase/epimerase